MTTTNVYQGLAGNRNSSRVLANPGGNSSDIFGTNHLSYANNPPQQAQQQTQPQSSNMDYERAKPSHSIYENNDIFGSGDANTQDVHTGRRIGLKPKDESTSNVFGGSMVGGDSGIHDDCKTISAEQANAAVQMARAKGLKPKDESADNVMGGSKVGGESQLRGDCKTISAEQANAAVQGQKNKARGKVSARNPLDWRLNPGQADEPTEPAALRSPRGQGLGPQGSTYNVISGEDLTPQEQHRGGKKHTQVQHDTRPW